MDAKPVIAIGSDHGGFVLKEALKMHLKALGYTITDFGTNSIESCDYPVYGSLVARAVAAKEAAYGIAICKTGFGMSIVTNKQKGVRSAVCDTPEEAETARRHNDCNVLALGARRVEQKTAKAIVGVFLTTGAEGGRHQRRVEQINDMEN